MCRNYVAAGGLAVFVCDSMLEVQRRAGKNVKTENRSVSLLSCVWNYCFLDFLSSEVAEQLASTAKYGWTPLHAAARGNAEAMGAVMNSLVNYMEADEVRFVLVDLAVRLEF